jgi:hypothetical protein
MLHIIKRPEKGHKWKVDKNFEGDGIVSHTSELIWTEREKP